MTFCNLPKYLTLNFFICWAGRVTLIGLLKDNVKDYHVLQSSAQRRNSIKFAFLTHQTGTGPVLLVLQLVPDILCTISAQKPAMIFLKNGKCLFKNNNLFTLLKPCFLCYVYFCPFPCYFSIMQQRSKILEEKNWPPMIFIKYSKKRIYKTFI